jgi:hypothetical protein
MPSVDVGVTEEEDHSFNLALRIFPDVELPPPPEAECKEELQVCSISKTCAAPKDFFVNPLKIL